jgi:hypothetical protein
VLEKNLIDQNQASIDIKSDKQSFQAFVIINIIIESMSSENIKLASNHQNATDFQTSMKTSQHVNPELIVELTLELITELTFELTTELTSELVTELTSELTTELTPELITKLTSELNTELITVLTLEINPEFEIPESYQATANYDHSNSLINIVLKLRRYVERKHFTSDENRLIMSHASI